MIVDNISNASHYYGLGERYAKAFNWLKKSNLDQLEEGKHDFEGDNIFAFVQKYVTAPSEECKPEAHRRYADIQYMVRGTEAFGYAPLENCVEDGAYDTEIDLIFYQADCDLIRIAAGDFFIALPQDVHMPRCIHRQPGEVVKVVVKVKL